MEIKTVNTLEELGENGKIAAKPLIQSGKQFSMSFDKLGLALVGFLAACQVDKVVLKQKVVVEIARCNKGYVSRISSALDASAKKHGGDYSKAQAEARELGIAQFLAQHKPTATQRGESTNKAPTNKKTATVPQSLGLDDMLAMARNLHEQIQRNMASLDQKGKQELATQLMETWDMLQQREAPARPAIERRHAA